MKGIRRKRRFQRGASGRRRLRLESLEPRRVLATFLVTTASDVVDPNDGVNSLREAIEQANSTAGADTIFFDATTFAGPTEIDLALGQLRATDPVEIIGPGKGLLTIDAGGASRVIEFVSYNGDLTLRGMTLTGGQTTAPDVNTDQSGGGIRFASAGTLTLERVDVLGNRTQGAGALGGGVFADPGNVVLQRSSIADNRTEGIDAHGGGIFVRSGSLSIVDSLVTGNATSGDDSRGGGIFSSGSTITINRSSVTDQQTSGDQSDGGAIWTSADLTIQSSSIVQNRTLGTESDGGGIFSNGAVTLRNSDLSLNTASGIGGGGGGIAIDSAPIVIENSSITGNQTVSQFGYGAGVFAIRSDFTMTGSTVSGNHSLGPDTDGGGIAVFFGEVQIVSSTITANSTTGQGGGVLMIDNANRTFRMDNSIVAGNIDVGTAPDFLGPTNPSALTVRSSLVGDNAGTTLQESQVADPQGNLVGDRFGDGVIDPRLAELRTVGTTRVHPLKAGSPALNAGDNLLSLATPKDQRGAPFARIFGGVVDMGALESQQVSASRFVVNTMVDEFDFQNATTSLREAIHVANGNFGHDTITFDATSIESDPVIGLTSALAITESLTVRAPVAVPVTLRAAASIRVIDVIADSGDFAFERLHVMGGRSSGPEGGGAGIRFGSNGTLTLTDSVVRDNHAAGALSAGGGIDAETGNVTLLRTNVSGNSTRGTLAAGGGVRASAVTLIDSTVADNRTEGANSSGGGIAVSNPDGLALQLQRSTVAGNETHDGTSHGGGISVRAGSSSIVSSTISGNVSGGDGGGVHWTRYGESAVAHQVVASTIAHNQSGQSAGGLSLELPDAGSFALTSSIVALNTASVANPDLSLQQASGDVTLRSSLIGDNSGTNLAGSSSGDARGNLIGSTAGGGAIDPLLAELATRGGRTASHALLPGSVAIDASRSELVGNLFTDQRNGSFVRVFGEAPDIGSFEVQTLDPSFFVVNTIDDVVDLDPSSVSLREVIEFASASDGVETIQFDPTVFATPQTIRLQNGPLVISDRVGIDGPGADLLTIDAGGRHHVLQIMRPAIDVSLSGMTLTGGVATDGPGGAIRFVSDGNLSLSDMNLQANRTTANDSGGGALLVDGGNVVISQSSITNNRTEGSGSGGGGILLLSGSASITDTRVEDNRTLGTDSRGGGIFAVDSDLRLQRVKVFSNRTLGDGSDGAGVATEAGTLTIVASHLDQNQTFGGSDGGGLKSDQTLVEIDSSAITGNRTNEANSDGAGLAVVSGSFQLINSTISGNSAAGTGGVGGGILASNVQTKIVNTTVTANSAGLDGGGIAEVALGSLQLDNSIVAANTGPARSPDLFVAIANPANLVPRFSLIGDLRGTNLAEAQQPDFRGNRIGSSLGAGVIDPVLGPLANNGGPIPTHEPQSGSPAIGSGAVGLALDARGQSLQFDGRGEPFDRVFQTVDQGAVEIQPPREPVIVWNRPENIFVDTPLGDQQLNASTNTSGTFTYSPVAGTVLPEGNDQRLEVTFVPDDTVHYTEATASVLLTVVDRRDRGDAPSSYGTLHASDGPRHVIGDLRLGDTVDVEVDAVPSVDADGDGADEDGVQFLTTMVTDANQLTVATLLVDASMRGKLDAWIDFDRNGIFDHPTEHLTDGVSFSLATGENLLSFTIPVGASAGTSYARFRISSEGGLLPTGPADDGEVEDYVVTLVDGATVPTVSVSVPLGQTTLRRLGNELVIGRGTRDLFRAPFTSVARFELQGNRFSNVLTIDSTNGSPIPAGGFSFDGAERVNTVRLVGEGLSLDLSAGGDTTLASIDVIDTSDSSPSIIRVDSQAARSMDPTGGGVILVGSANDQLEIADGPQWRMAAPSGVAGLFFSVVRLSDTFLQVDFTSLWQNLAQASDVNNDGEVTAADALRIINELSRRSFSDPVTSELVSPGALAAWPGVYFDQNGDGRATALDALRVVNELARLGDSSAAGEWIVGVAVTQTDDDEEEGPPPESRLF